MKDSSLFACVDCGSQSPRWMGFCPSCGSKEPLIEVYQQESRRGSWVLKQSEPLELSGIELDDYPRIVFPDNEFNRVLGGGIVPGSVILLAGDPGVGKSTLLLQSANSLVSATNSSGGKVFYVSGEEANSQIRMRADRLGLSGRNLFLLDETEIDSVFSQLADQIVSALVIDSIQTVYCNSHPGSPGTVGQIRETTRRLINWAKSRMIPVLIAGHVTKDGEVAGPRILEHMVDVVLYLEGESFGPLRILRGIKNRFGSTGEVAVFQMEEDGLKEIADPSQALLSGRSNGQIGSAVVSVLEGTRPLLVEIQALTVPSYSSIPRRIATGIDVNRLVMLSAVLDRRAGIQLGGQDIIVNVVGGLKITEPAIDLGVVLAISSSVKGVPLIDEMVVMGEIGLAGEVRGVSQLGRRLEESSRLGFKSAIAGIADLSFQFSQINLSKVDNISEAIKIGMPRGNLLADLENS